jgi:diguanylate cyclase (GGDEF)-like protein
VSLATFRLPKPSFLAEFDAFAANVEPRHRFLLTFKDGAHLVGVPTVRSVQDPTDPDALFVVTTAIDSYEIPFRLLAYAQQLVESGLRASDGQEPVPEPCTGPVQRAKHEKFAILDSPRLVAEDLQNAGGLFGTAVLYVDIDHFKALNTKHTERVIDRTVLPEFQKLVASCVERRGYAYAEGGDEVVILLPNTSIPIAAAFAEELRHQVEQHRFTIDEDTVRITLSLGVASSVTELPQLPDWANQAKKQAKDRGRNRTVATSDGLTFREVAADAMEPARSSR